MPRTYDHDALGKTLDTLEAQLNQTTPEAEDQAADLVKSLAEVAKGAIDLATDRSDRKGRRKRGKAKDAAALAKARKAKDEDDEEEDDDDNNDNKDDDDDSNDGTNDMMPAWLKDTVSDGKAAGDMILAEDREDTGGGPGSLGKSVRIGDVDVVDVGEFLAKTARQQAEMAKAVRRVEKLSKALIDGLVAVDQRIRGLEADSDDHSHFMSVCAKALGYVIDHHEDALAQPVNGSRYAGMEKSIVLAQRQIDAAGGTLFKTKGPGSERNRELLAKAAQTGKITSEQLTYIKNTERLPAGLSLS
jgi:hypothetical protein